MNLLDPARIADLATILSTSSREELQDILATLDAEPRLQKMLTIVKQEYQRALTQQEIAQQVSCWVWWMDGWVWCESNGRWPITAVVLVAATVVLVIGGDGALQDHATPRDAMRWYDDDDNSDSRDVCAQFRVATRANAQLQK
jgi:hypothetical protein